MLKHILKIIFAVLYILYTAASYVIGEYGHFLGLIFMATMWLLRTRLKNFASKFWPCGYWPFLFLGVLVAESMEIVYYIGGFRFMGGFSLLEVVLLTLTGHIVFLTITWTVNLRYRYSPTEVFLAAGLFGLVNESFYTPIFVSPTMLVLAGFVLFIGYAYQQGFAFWLMHDKLPKPSQKGNSITRIVLLFILLMIYVLIWTAGFITVRNMFFPDAPLGIDVPPIWIQ